MGLESSDVELDMWSDLALGPLLQVEMMVHYTEVEVLKM